MLTSSILSRPWTINTKFILEHTSSDRVKLIDRLSDPHTSLFNQITSPEPSTVSSELVDKCFICVRVHGFPVCIPSFCKKGRNLKNKNRLLRKLRLR